jgi:hypothetical protein
MRAYYDFLYNINSISDTIMARTTMTTTAQLRFNPRLFHTTPRLSHGQFESIPANLHDDSIASLYPAGPAHGSGHAAIIPLFFSLLR